MAHVDVEIPHF